jgi:hypothetical protein
MATPTSGGGALHGLVELQVVADKGEPVSGTTFTQISGIDRQDWEATDCPELCEAMRQVYYLKLTEPL